MIDIKHAILSQNYIYKTKLLFKKWRFYALKRYKASNYRYSRVYDTIKMDKKVIIILVWSEKKVLSCD